MLGMAFFSNFQMPKEDTKMAMDPTPFNQSILFDSNKKRNFFADQKINPNFAYEFSVRHQGSNTLNPKSFNKKLKYMVYNFEGKLIYYFDLFEKGDNIIILTNTWPAGTYIIQSFDQNKLIQEAIIIKK